MNDCCPWPGSVVNKKLICRMESEIKSVIWISQRTDSIIIHHHNGVIRGEMSRHVGRTSTGSVHKKYMIYNAIQYWHMDSYIVPTYIRGWKGTNAWVHEPEGSKNPRLHWQMHGKLRSSSAAQTQETSLLLLGWIWAYKLRCRGGRNPQSDAQSIPPLQG